MPALVVIAISEFTSYLEAVCKSTDHVNQIVARAAVIFFSLDETNPSTAGVQYYFILLPQLGH